MESFAVFGSVCLAIIGSIEIWYSFDSSKEQAESVVSNIERASRFVCGHLCLLAAFGGVLMSAMLHR